jgi:hypothetical protein
MHLARVELKGSKSLIVQSVAIDGDDCEILGTMRREQAGLQPIDMHNFWQLFEDRAKELGIKQMHGYVPLELGEFYIRTYENVQAIEGECPYEGMIHLEINLW